MFVIVVYDISTSGGNSSKRLRDILKLCRQYLHHTQKSVFEGEISIAKLIYFKKEVEKIINECIDYVVIYEVENKNNIKRGNIGIDFDPQDSII